jgi:hypothetical protein
MSSRRQVPTSTFMCDEHEGEDDEDDEDEGVRTIE